MEKNDFLENLDVNKDGQIDEQDVKCLGKILEKKGAELTEFVNNLEKSKSLKETLFAIKPSFDSLIQGSDFKMSNSPDAKENIILIQFYAKFIEGKTDVVMNGEYSNNIEELYFKFALKMRQLDEVTFGNNKEVDYFKKWLAVNDSITLQVVSRKEFNESNAVNQIATKNDRKGDGKDKPQGYDLKLPEDLKDGEIPLIMKQINTISYGENPPEHTAYKTFQKKLDGYITYLESSVDEFKDRPEYGVLLGKVKGMYEQNYGKGKIETSLNPTEVSNGIKAKIDLQFQDISNTKILKLKGDPNVRLKMIETLISKELNQYLQLAVFERGSQTLFDYMTVAKASDMKYLLDPKKRKEAGVKNIDSTLEKKIDSMGDVKKKLKDTLQIGKYTQELNDAKMSGNKEKVNKIEQQICNEMLTEIARYPWTDMESSENSYPAKILETQKMVCTGKSIIAHSLLQELGIQHETLNVWGHSALIVHLSDGKEYYCDPTNSTELAEFKNLQGAKGGIYEKGELILKNSFVDGGKIQLVSNGALTDKDGLLHFGRADSEFGLMGQIYNNISTDSDLGMEEKIIFLERSREINPNNIDVYSNLVKAYREIGNYKQSIMYGEEGLKIDPDSISLRQRLSDTHSDISERYFNTGNIQFALKSAQMAIQYFEQPFSLNLVGVIYISEGNNEGAIPYFLRSLEASKDLTISPIAIQNLEIALTGITDNTVKSNGMSKLGAYFISIKRYPEARKEFEQVLQIDSGNWNGYYRLGNIDFYEGKYEEMEKKYNKAIYLAPEDRKKGLRKELQQIKDSIKNTTE